MIKFKILVLTIRTDMHIMAAVPLIIPIRIGITGKILFQAISKGQLKPIKADMIIPINANMQFFRNEIFVKKTRTSVLQRLIINNKKVAKGIDDKAHGNIIEQ